MKWIEIIKLRSTRNYIRSAEDILSSMDGWSQSGLKEIGVYRHALLEVDLSIHLYWETERPERAGSGLGLHLVQALKEFGLIDHTVWEKVNRSIKH